MIRRAMPEMIRSDNVECFRRSSQYQSSSFLATVTGHRIFAVFDRSKYTGLPQRNPLSKLRETPQGLCTEDHLHTRHTFMQSPALKRSTDEDCAAAGLLDKNVPGQLRNMLGNNIQHMG